MGVYQKPDKIRRINWIDLVKAWCKSNILIHIALYYIVCFLSVLAIIHLWRCADKNRSKIVIYISIGTMVIFGLHRMLISIIDYIIEKTLHISDIIYSTPETIILTLVIELSLLPIIIYGKRHCPIFLGKRHTS